LEYLILKKVIGIPLIILTLLISLWIDETPRYLVSKKEYSKARKVLDKIA